MLPTRRPLSLIICAALAAFCASNFCLAVPATAAEHTVNIVGNAFVPSSLTVAASDTVTWINDGGLHNVVADDASFTSGPPSTDAWQFSHTFHVGGSFGYSCEIHADQGMVGTVAVEGIFGDGLESGDTSVWSGVAPSVPNCTCYFSSDCPAGNRCDWGPGGPSTVDICTWVDGKPDGVVGAGCDLPHIGPWGGDICDGVCAPFLAGSSLGWEDATLVRRAAELWGAAMLEPSIAGGGPLEPRLVDAAMDLGFESSQATLAVGREVADVLILAADAGFADYFCDHEHHPGAPDPATFVDLSESSCRAHAGRLAIEALVAELDQTGSGGAIVARIPEQCPSWQELFAPICEVGPGALRCLEERIAGSAVFLKRPRDFQAFLAQLGAPASSSARP